MRLRHENVAKLTRVNTSVQLGSPKIAEVRDVDPREGRLSLIVNYNAAGGRL